MRDVENVRYCHTTIDGQQIGRCEYALRNMEIWLLTIHNYIQAGRFDADTLDALVQTKNAWAGMKHRLDSYLGEIHQIISQTSAALRPVRVSLVVVLA